MRSLEAGVAEVFAGKERVPASTDISWPLGWTTPVFQLQISRGEQNFLFFPATQGHGGVSGIILLYDIIW